MTDPITNSDSMLPCGCRTYVPPGKVIHQIEFCEDHAATYAKMAALKAELDTLKLRHSVSINRNLEERKQYHAAERFIDDLAGLLREVLHKIPEDDSTYYNVVNAIVICEKRNKKQDD